MVRLSRRVRWLVVVAAVVLVAVLAAVVVAERRSNAALHRDQTTCYAAGVRAYEAAGGGSLGQAAQQDRYDSCMTTFGH